MYRWPAPAAPGGSVASLSGLAADLGLDRELPEMLSDHAVRWVKFGVVERGYARRRPDDFAWLVGRHGRTAVEKKSYTASSFLASTLSLLARSGTVVKAFGPATGRWSYNESISWWTLPPAPAWSDRLSWADSGRSMRYVPGAAPSEPGH